MLREALIYRREDYPTDGDYRVALNEALVNHGALLTPMYLGLPTSPARLTTVSGATTTTPIITVTTKGWSPS